MPYKSEQGGRKIEGKRVMAGGQYFDGKMVLIFATETTEKHRKKPEPIGHENHERTRK